METGRLGRCSRASLAHRELKASLDYIRMSLKYNKVRKKKQNTYRLHHHPVSFMTKSHGGKMLGVFLCLINFSLIVVKYSIRC